MIILCDGCSKKFDNGSLICPFCGEGHMEYEDTSEDNANRAEIEETVFEDNILSDADILLENDFH